MKVDIITFANNAFMDNRNRLSIIQTFDRLYLDKVPANLVNAVVVTKLRDKPNKTVKLNLQISDSKGDKILNQDVEVKFSQHGTTTIVVEAVGLLFKSYGEYELVLSNEGKVLAKTSLYAEKSSEKTSDK
jgi:hypothetical protein